MSRYRMDLDGNRIALRARTYGSRTSWLLDGPRRAVERWRQERFERKLVAGTGPWKVNAYCFVCRRPTTLRMDEEHSWIENGARALNWRERLICPTCGLNSRMRAALHLVSVALGTSGEARIYATEQMSSFFGELSRRFSDVTGSEFRGYAEAGGATDDNGLRHENVEQLSFPDHAFDLIISQDVLEHVAHPERAFREFRRVLRAGGTLLLSVPFDPRRRRTLRRAEIGVAGEVVHHLPPDYHFDPLDPAGCLVFSEFGWDILELLQICEFHDLRIVRYWSSEFGYLGRFNTMFVGRVSRSAVGRES